MVGGKKRYGGEQDFGTLGRVTDEVQEGHFSRQLCLAPTSGQSSVSAKTWLSLMNSLCSNCTW